MKKKREFTKLNHFIGNLRISTLLFFYIIIIALFSSALLITCHQIQLYITQNMMESISKQILDIQNLKSITIQAQEEEQVINLAFDLVLQKLSKIVMINYYSEQKANLTTQNLLNCNNEYSILSSICYSELISLNQTSSQILKLGNMLQQYQMALNTEELTQLIDIISYTEQLATLYVPSKIATDTIEGRNTAWFQNYTYILKTTGYLSLYISDIFVQQPYNYLTATCNTVLVNQYLNVTGVVSLMINFPNLTKWLFIEKLSIIVTHVTGAILYSKSFFTQNVTSYITQMYNESLTGFDENEWNTIIQSINSSGKPVNVFNSLLREDIYVKPFQLSHTPLVILIMPNSTYEKEMNSLQQQRFDEISSQHLQIYFIIIFCELIFIILWIIPIKAMFRSIQFVIELMLQYINGQFQHKIKDEFSFGFLKMDDNCLLKFYNSYKILDNKLNQTQFIKSEQCNLLEKFHFPSQIISKEFNQHINQQQLENRQQKVNLNFLKLMTNNYLN